MKKICFITTKYAAFRNFLKKFSEFLFKSGEYDISLICDGDSVDKSDLPEFVHFYPVKMKRGVSLSVFSAIKKIKKICKKQKFDIVQYSTPNAAFCASIAAKKAKIPVRLYCQWGIRYMGFMGVKRKIFKLIEKITCRNSTFIEAESFGIIDFARSEKLYSSEDSCVIWNGSACGVDLDKFDISFKNQWRKEIRSKYGLSDDTLVLVFAARITRDKGLNELLTAYFNICEKHDGVKLFILGQSNNVKSIDADLWNKAHDCDKIIFTGKVFDIEKYYAASDVFISPSYREGFGLVVIEAESMGLPAIVTDVPGQIDAIKPNITGLTCKVKDAVSLENAIESLINSPDMRKNFGDNAVEYVKDGYDQQKLFGLLKENRDNLISGVKCLK